MRDVTPPPRRRVWIRRFCIAALALCLGAVTGLLSMFPAALLHSYLGAPDPWQASIGGIPGGIGLSTLFWGYLLWRYSRKAN